MHATRDQRITALHPVEIRWDAMRRTGWVHNVSRRGMMLSCTPPPPANSYIEVKLGDSCYAARVAWSNGTRFGVRTREPVMFAPGASSAARAAVPTGGLRLASLFPGVDPRMAARAMQFVSITAAAAVFALLLASQVSAILSRTAKQIEMHLR